MKTAMWLQLMVLGLLWGGSFFFVEIALNGFGPLTLVLIRVLLAAILLGAVASLQGHRVPWGKRIWGGYWVMGLLSNVLPFSLISWGQQYITSSDASIINATVPIFTVLLIQLTTRDENRTFGKNVGVVVGFFGVLALMWPGFESGATRIWVGHVAVLCAAFCYAAGAIYGKRFGGNPAIVNAACMLTCSAVVLAPAALILERPFETSPEVGSWAAVIGLAVLSSAIAYLLYFSILKRGGATYLSLVTYLIPVAATVLGVLFLEEAFTVSSFVGVSVVFLGLVIIDGRLFQYVSLGWGRGVGVSQPM